MENMIEETLRATKGRVLASDIKGAERGDICGGAGKGF